MTNPGYRGGLRRTPSSTLMRRTVSTKSEGADDGADGGPGEQRVDVALADPLADRFRQHEPSAEQEADGDADTVRRDGERPDVDLHDGRIGDRREHGPILTRPARPRASMSQ